MHRRDLLGTGGAGVLAGLAGCPQGLGGAAHETPRPSTASACADRRFPARHRGVIRVDSATAPDDPSIVIGFDTLPPAEQRIVTRAIERDRYAICLPAASAERVDAFASLVERIRDRPRSPTVGPPLERNGSYYRVTNVRSRDQVFVTTTP